MDRSPRLRRYQRKDYTQRVEFPVEIVGRDNLIRRYSFDDAVRLYRRRIQSAPIRYDDAEMIDAEVRHCRSRIDQLRRSYIDHAGWGWARDGAARGVLGTPLAAEIGSFLRRVFNDDAAIGGGLSISPVSTGACDTCFLRPAGGDRSYLLYCYRLDASGPAGAKLEFEADLTRLRAAGTDADVERLFACQKSPDLGLILAGVGAWNGPGVELDMAPEAAAEPEPGGDPWREATRALHDGDASAALARFEAGMDANPGRRILPQSAAALALLGRQAERAEFAARYGLLHSPADQLLQYFLAVSLLHQRRDADAAEVVRGFVGRDPLFSLVLGALELRDRRWRAAWRHLSSCIADAPEDAWFIQRTARALRFAAAHALGNLALAIAAFGLGVAAFTVGHPILGAVAILVAPIQAAVSIIRLDRRVRRAVSTPSGEIRLVSPELMPREGETPARN